VSTLTSSASQAAYDAVVPHCVGKTKISLIYHPKYAYDVEGDKLVGKACFSLFLFFFLIYRIETSSERMEEPPASEEFKEEEVGKKISRLLAQSAMMDYEIDGKEPEEYLNEIFVDDFKIENLEGDSECDAWMKFANLIPQSRIIFLFFLIVFLVKSDLEFQFEFKKEELRWSESLFHV